MKKKTKQMVGLGIGLIAGSAIAGKIGQTSGASAAVSGNIGTAFEIGSLAMPILAGSLVMDATENLIPKDKKKKKTNSIL